jgi:alpha-L-arabinofuranosidase
MFVKNMNPDQLAPAPSSGGQAGSPDSLALLAAMGEVPPQGMKRIAVGQGLGQRAYTEAVMKAWQTRMPFLWSVEGLSLHHYTHTAPYPMTDASFGFGEREYAQLLEKTYKMNDMIVEHSAIMDKYDPQKKVAIAIDEWGAWLKPLPNTPMMFLRQQNSLRDAVLASINLNIFARHADRVRMTNIAQMVNVIQSMILTDGPKMVLTPTYHVYRMYVPFQDATFIPITLEAGEYRSGSVRLPQVDAIAARAKDGKIWLALANLDPARPAELRLSGVDASAAVGEVLTGEAVSSINTFEAPQAVVPKPFSARTQGGILMLRLQPKSITVVQLQP